MWDDQRLLEFLPREEAAAAQRELLRNHVAYAFAHSPFYRRKLAAFADLIPNLTEDTLTELPMTDKSEFAKENESFLATPLRQVTDTVFSSGTTGNPTAVMYSRRDVERLAFNERISLRGCGITADDIGLMTCTLDRCFVAGFAYYLGLLTIGATVARNGIASVQSHAQVMRRLRPTVLVGVPGFLTKLGLYLRDSGQENLLESVQKIVCAGDPLRDREMNPLPVTERLEAIWGAKAYSTYASSEIISSFCECTAQRGGHLHPELAVVEIVDEQGRRVPAGEVGEVVVTPLQIESMPFVRFRTGDLSFLIDEPCSCGRTSVRLGPILGRKAQLMKVRGTSVYPAAFFQVLDAHPGISGSYLTVRGDRNLSDEVTVTVSVTDTSLTVVEIAEALHAVLRIHPTVIIDTAENVAAKIFDPLSHKPRRFFDERVGERNV
ncbi:MAG: AMP-binding protein [Kiritimatiellae bacterium]|nr:AMP-binding protein [Kiritimatiellia bacterium]